MMRIAERALGDPLAPLIPGGAWEQLGQARINAYAALILSEDRRNGR